MHKHIGFNKPYMTGQELVYIEQAVKNGKISGDGIFTQKCNQFFESHYGFPKVLLTTSCTAALELSALLLDLAPGDEVIVPSFTFVSSANAFVIMGATIVFADIERDTLTISPQTVSHLITPRTKAIVAVNYGGAASVTQDLVDLAKAAK